MSTDPHAQISARLAEARLRAGMSQAEAARRIGLERAQTIGDWEAGKYGITLQNLIALCRAYSASADWILGLAEAPSVRGSGGIIDLAVERAVMRAASGREILAEARRLAAWRESGILWGYEVPPEFEVLDGDEWALRRDALLAKLKRLANDQGIQQRRR